jgi:hypothetical protein
VVPVLHHAQEFGVVVNMNSFVFFGVSVGNFETAVRAAIVDYGVLPSLIGLGKYTFDALTQILFSVVQRGDNVN